DSPRTRPASRSSSSETPTPPFLPGEEHRTENRPLPLLRSKIRIKTPHRVRWREAGRNRARTFDRKADAARFETEVRRRQQTGDLPPVEGGRETLAVFAEKWWKTYAVPNLPPKTQRIY